MLKAIFPNYIQINYQLNLIKGQSSFQKFVIKKEKGDRISYLSFFYCALPTFTGSSLPSDVLQRLAPQTMSSVADP